MATRRLSLTFLLVAPLVVTAQDYEEVQTQEPLSAVSGEHLPVGNNNHNKVQLEVLDPWSPGEVPGDSTTLWESEETTTTTGDMDLSRVKREDGEDMETAEQVLFRPIFRHRQMIADRLERQRQRNADRRQSQAADFGAAGSLQVAQNRFSLSQDFGVPGQAQYSNAKYASLANPGNTKRSLRPVLVR